MTYPNPEDLAQWAGAEDDNAEWCVNAAAAAIEQACGRVFTQLAESEERTYRAEYHCGRTVVDIDDLTTTDDLTVEVDGVEVLDYILLPRNASQKNRPWTQIELPRATHGWVNITAKWGWDTPAAIRLATSILAARLYERRENPAGLTSKSVDDVSVSYPSAGALDDEVQTLIAPYVKRWAAV